MSRHALVLLAALAALCAAPASAGDEATPPPDAACAAYVSAGDGVLTFRGEGDLVTAPFELRPGAAILTVEVTGARLFVAHVAAWPGDEVEYGPMLTGDGRGQDVVAFDGGTYVVDADGDGAWTVTIDQG